MTLSQYLEGVMRDYVVVETTSVAAETKECAYDFDELSTIGIEVTK